MSLAKPFQVIDVHTHVGTDMLFYLREQHPYALDWPTLLEIGGGLGINRFVVFPMPTHLGLNVHALWQGIVTAKDGLEQIPYAFENRRMMTEISRDEANQHRALPLWMFDPEREPERQCAALRALHKDYPTCAGLKVQATIIQSRIANLMKTGACLLDLAEEKNWPILIHTSVHPKDPWSPVADILEIVKSRPGIRFNLAHSCRFDRPTLDQIAELPNVWFDCSAHIIHCRLAQKDSVAIAEKARRFATDYADPAQVLADLAAAYPHKLMWGSDAPFYSYCDQATQLMTSYGEEMKVLRALNEPIIKRIAYTNTLAFLGQ